MVAGHSSRPTADPARYPLPMAGDSQLMLLMIAGVHLLGLACVAVLMYTALREGPADAAAADGLRFGRRAGQQAPAPAAAVRPPPRRDPATGRRAGSRTASRPPAGSPISCRSASGGRRASLSARRSGTRRTQLEPSPGSRRPPAIGLRLIASSSIVDPAKCVARAADSDALDDRLGLVDHLPGDPRRAERAWSVRTPSTARTRGSRPRRGRLSSGGVRGRRAPGRLALAEQPWIAAITAARVAARLVTEQRRDQPTPQRCPHSRRARARRRRTAPARSRRRPAGSVWSGVPRGCRPARATGR